MKLLWGGLFLLFLRCSGKEKIQRQLQTEKIHNWVCVYNDDVSLDNIKKFDLAVLDSDLHPDFSDVQKSKTIFIGYLSLGEVGDYRWYWEKIADKPWVLDKNPNWGGRMIDVRAKEWHNLLIKKIIPKIIEQGFDGVFLDNVDNAEYLEKYHTTKKYPGAQNSMISLIKNIRKRFPAIYIIVNRGFAILESIGPWVDGVVAEAIFSNIDFENNEYRLQSPLEYQPYVNLLQEVKHKFNLAVFTLDYIQPENTLDSYRIIKKSRELGLIPYISTPKLDSIYFLTLESL